MITTLRAAVAVALLAGFYVLVAVITAVTVAADFLLVRYGHSGGAKAAGVATIAVIAMLRGALLVGRRPADPEPGVEISAADEPALWHAVAALARQARTRVPDEIRLVADVNAAVSEETRMLGLIAGRRRLYVGVPLLLSLTVDELRAVLCHELGHYSGAHTRLGGITYRGRISLNRTIAHLQGHAAVRSVFSLYAALFFRVSFAVSRRQELEADATAVAVAGRRAMAEALRKSRTSAAAWKFYVDSYCPLIPLAGARPPDLFAGYYALLREPGRQRMFARMLSVPEKRTPLDSHPSMADRLTAIERLPDPALRPDTRPALRLLASPDRAARATQSTMLTPEAQRLPERDWPEIAGRALYAGTHSQAIADVFAAAGRLAGTARPTAATVLRVLEAGGGRDLGGWLRDLKWAGDDAGAVAARVTARALEGLLIEAGLAWYEFSWSADPQLFARDGAPVDLTMAVLTAVTDPRRASSLAERLLRLGLSPSAVPRGDGSRPPAAAGAPSGFSQRC